MSSNKGETPNAKSGGRVEETTTTEEDEKKKGRKKRREPLGELEKKGTSIFQYGLGKLTVEGWNVPVHREERGETLVWVTGKGRPGKKKKKKLISVLDVGHRHQTGLMGRKGNVSPARKKKKEGKGGKAQWEVFAGTIGKKKKRDLQRGKKRVCRGPGKKKKSTRPLQGRGKKNFIQAN